MKKKNIKKLVITSYTKNNLDGAKVEAIIKYLSRQEQKLYLRMLKESEKQNCVYVFLPFPPNLPLQKKLQEQFSEKKIRYEIDKNLLGGIKIIQNDTIIEYNIQHTLQEITSHVAS